MKVYVVTHNFVSHDMFVSNEAKMGAPQVVGVFTSRSEAQKYIRPGMDDFIQTFTLDRVKR